MPDPRQMTTRRVCAMAHTRLYIGAPIYACRGNPPAAPCAALPTSPPCVLHSCIKHGQTGTTRLWERLAGHINAGDISWKTMPVTSPCSNVRWTRPCNALPMPAGMSWGQPHARRQNTSQTARVQPMRKSGRKSPGLFDDGGHVGAPEACRRPEACHRRCVDAPTHVDGGCVARGESTARGKRPPTASAPLAGVSYGP